MVINRKVKLQSTSDSGFFWPGWLASLLLCQPFRICFLKRPLSGSLLCFSSYNIPSFTKYCFRASFSCSYTEFLVVNISQANCSSLAVWALIQAVITLSFQISGCSWVNIARISKSTGLVIPRTKMLNHSFLLSSNQNSIADVSVEVLGVKFWALSGCTKLGLSSSLGQFWPVWWWILFGRLLSWLEVDLKVKAAWCLFALGLKSGKFLFGHADHKVTMISVQNRLKVVRVPLKVVSPFLEGGQSYMEFMVEYLLVHLGLDQWPG